MFVRAVRLVVVVGAVLALNDPRLTTRQTRIVAEICEDIREKDKKDQVAVRLISVSRYPLPFRQSFPCCPSYIATCHRRRRAYILQCAYIDMFLFPRKDMLCLETTGAGAYVIVVAPWPIFGVHFLSMLDLALRASAWNSPPSTKDTRVVTFLSCVVSFLVPVYVVNLCDAAFLDCGVVRVWRWYVSIADFVFVKLSP